MLRLVARDWPPGEMAGGQHYCLRWNNYQSNMTSVFHHLLCTEAFVDVTLACNEESLKAHKVVLSACSSYFQKLLLENPCKHPTIIMPQDVCFSDLKFIIEFVYRGEIDVSQAELQSLLKTADQLKIKGLCEVPESGKGCDDDEEESSEPVGAEVTQLLPPLAPTMAQRLSGGPFNKLRRVHTRSTRRSFSELRAGSVHCPKACPPPSPLLDHHMDHQQQMQVVDHHQHMIVATSMDDGGQHAQALPAVVSGCITVATSTEEDQKGAELPVVILENRVQQHSIADNRIMMTSPAPIMSTHSLPSQQVLVESSVRGTEMELPLDTQPTGPTATLVSTMEIEHSPPLHRDMSVDTSGMQSDDVEGVKVKFETLRAIEQADSIDMVAERNGVKDEHTMHTMMITPELLGLIPSSSIHSDTGSGDSGCKNGTGVGLGGSKAWTQEDMDAALEALRTGATSLTKASAAYGIPSTTLWQRAHRLGIGTPKKDGPAKSWTEDSLNVALDALRTGSISANKASKAYGIPSSTLYKIARREGIRLAAPFNAAPTAWNPDDLERALEAIRTGQTTVQRAATEYGIPSGTLYGRCKREGIELSRSNPTPWSEEAMTEALEAVRVGQMSINQAAIHYNLPYSSLYGRFKRGKYEADHLDGSGGDLEEGGLSPPPPLAPPQPPQQQAPPPHTHIAPPQIMLVQYQQAPAQLHMTYQQHPGTAAS